MIKGALLLCYPLLFSCLALISCAGSRGEIKMNQSRYPVSLSPVIIDNGRMYVESENVHYVTKINLESRKWSIFYTLIPLNNLDSVPQEMDRIIKQYKGNGIMNLSLSAKACKWNFLFPLNALPFWPGCTRILLQGDIVRF